MQQQVGPSPTCPLCGQRMDQRARAPEQQWLAPEYVCLDLECLEFGVYRAHEPSYGPPPR